ncbi:DUF11 domain-containing protein [Zobellia amurskyensis]|uniref:DUF11 domain-containing protein n=1 Tax=Zobellia amurskyensis TaxID=248905 RepID=A0A7X2ZX19_9FLAO|nr:gliding motility-associated C-terminal domain-containing protein [Zobellia amurskyensis]MUH37904.1 DUF11 domain-containing protein [Zobellia amurskyensis]
MDVRPKINLAFFGEYPKYYGVLLLFVLFMGESLWAQPANDAIANATPLSINGCSADAAYNTLNATPDGTIGSCWPAGPNANVWFSFVASATGTVQINLDRGTITGDMAGDMRYAMMALWDATGTTEIACSSFTDVSDDISILQSGLTPGSTYLFSVDRRYGTPSGAESFKLCLSDTPTNDYLEGAINIDSFMNGCSADAAFSTLGASADRNAGSCWGTGPHRNVWFEVTAPATGNIEVKLDTGDAKGTVQTAYLALWDSTGTTELGCNSYRMGRDYDDISLLATGLTPGDSYYVSVDNRYIHALDTFSLCLSDQATNDYYQGAIDITGLIGGCSTDAEYTTLGATFDRNTGSCWLDLVNHNKWFSFVAPPSGKIEINLDRGDTKGTLRHAYMSLWENDGVTELACTTYSDPEDDLRIRHWSLTPGATYYLTVDNRYITTTDTFTLCLDAMDGPDTDGDGVGDAVDLDDDNDGIYDTVEGCENTNLSGTVGIGNAITDTTYSLVGTDVTYKVSKPASTNIYAYDAGANGHGIRIEGQAGDTGSLTSTYSTPIKNVFFKMTDFDNQTQITVEVYDENNVLYNLDLEGLVLVGSEITQTGNDFAASSADSDGNNPADDAAGAIYFYFEQTVSRVVLTYNHVVNSSTRFIQPTFCIADFDNDGITDHKDLDSDGDGIPDNVEGQTTLGYTVLNPDDAATYRANLGVNSAYLGGLIPTNTDTTDNPDYLDLDSDNEGGNDISEAMITLSGNDIDSDGLDDNMDAFTAGYDDPGGTIDNPISNPIALPDTDNDASSGGDVDFRDASDDRTDTDNDGVVDAVDLDDDNDGIPDIHEQGTMFECSETFLLDGAHAVNTHTTSQINSDSSGITWNLQTSGGVTLDTSVDPDFNNTVAYPVPAEFQNAQTHFMMAMNTDRNVGQHATLTITFPNPVKNPTMYFGNLKSSPGIGRRSVYYELTNVGVDMDLLFTDGDFYVADNRIGTSFNDTSLRGTGLVRFNGVFTNLTFTIGHFSNINEDGLIRTNLNLGYYDCVATGFSSNADTDNDGIVNSLDLDSDNDGIYDAVEAGHSQSHTNGRLDGAVGADGIPDAVRLTPDYSSINYDIAESTDDADLNPDFLDLDADGDGIPDNVEAQTSSGYLPPNADNTATYLTNSGVNSAYLGGLNPTNTDTTDNRDYLDLDSDNEGANDTIEASITLSNTDIDNDGLDDAIDADTTSYADPGGTIDDPKTAPVQLPDEDNDVNTGGDLDFRDATDDRADNDLDGVADEVDLDDDNDGILDIDENTCSNISTGQNVSSNLNTLQNSNTLLDAGIKYLLDIQNVSAAGILTGVAVDGPFAGETINIYLTNTTSGGATLNDVTAVYNSDFTYNAADSAATGGLVNSGFYVFYGIIDTNGNGTYEDGVDELLGPIDPLVANSIPISTTSGPLYFYYNDGIYGDNLASVDYGVKVENCDTDGDGVVNIFDLDADNDGIPDNVEAQTTIGYIAPSGVDSDGNGLDDTYETSPGSGEGITPTNTDGTDNPDYLDLDSDNEGANDTTEAGIILTGNDADNDGLDDATDATPDSTDVGGTIDDPLTAPIVLPDLDNDASTGGDVNFRDAIDDRPDNDNDGIVDEVDMDDDNDGIPDIEECLGENPSMLTYTIGSGQTITNASYGLSVTSTGYPIIGVGVNGIGMEEDAPGHEFTFAEPVGRLSFTLGNVHSNNEIGDFQLTLADGTIVQNADFTVTHDPAEDVYDYQSREDSGNADYAIHLVKRVGAPYPAGIRYVDNGPGTGQSWGILLFEGYELNPIVKIAFSQHTGPNLGMVGDFASLRPVDCDTDEDGIFNYFDLDSDNDGIFDAVEVGHSQAQTNGTVDGATGADGIPDSVQSVVDDRQVNYTFSESAEDVDTIYDFLDLDSDGDLIPDNVEAQTTVGYLSPAGTVDANGVDTAYTSGIVPTNTDGADNPDYLDIDSDNDGISDTTEARFRSSGVDSDNDGLDDATDATSDYTDVGGIIDNPLTAPEILPDVDSDATTGGDVDFRDLTDDRPDNDNDGIVDDADLDDDNDGILDTDEGCGNFIINGSFEQDDFRDPVAFPDGFTGANGTFIGTTYNTNTLSAWNYTQNLDGWVNSGSFGSGTFAPAINGSQYIDIIGNNNVTGGVSNELTQTVDLIVGQSYTFSFYWGEDIGHLSGQTVTLDFDIIDSNSIALLDETLTTIATGEVGGYTGPKNWFYEERTFVATTTQITVRFSAQPFATNSASGAALDLVSLKYSAPGACRDSDNDGIPDAFDLDSDNDGIYDAVEAGHDQAHTNGVLVGVTGTDGIPDSVQSIVDNRAVNYTLSESADDTDTIFDFIDLDSDGDGIPDNVEAQTTIGYIPPSGTIDANGVDTAYTLGLVPTNTDGADNPDYLDTDSDNEGANDTMEANITLTGTDSDNDGLDDATDATADYSDVGGTIDNPLTGSVILPDNDSDATTGGDVDYRDDDTVLLPFTCDESLYLSQHETATATTFYDLESSTNPFAISPVGDNSHGIEYNAMGYNPIDDFVYGIEENSNTLIKVAADGTTIRMGTITGLPVDLYSSGEIDDNGNYFVQEDGPSSIIYQIDIVSRTASIINLSQSIVVNDFAYNITNNLIYAVMQNGTDAGALLTIDVGTGLVNIIGSTNSLTLFGAMYASSTGEIYGNLNTGGFYQFDILTGERTLISASSSASHNDGAHCVTAPIVFEANLAVTKTDGTTTYVPGTSTTYTIVATNNGPFGVVGASVTDIPTGIPAANISYSAVASSGSTTALSGTQTGTISDIVSLPVGGTVTYTVTVNVPTSFSGDLTNTVTIKTPVNTNDPDVSDNTATDINTAAIPDMTIGDASATEGNAVSFPVTLSNVSTTDITVTFTLTNGTAGDSDYTTTDIQVTIHAGITTVNVDVPTTDDTIDEIDEDFTIAIASVDAGTVGDTSDTATGTIIDDDGSPIITIDDASATEGSNISFPVTLSNASTTDITLTFTLTNGTADDTDYTTTDIQVTIPAGAITINVDVPTTDDIIDEIDEDFTIAIASVDAGTVGDISDTATGTILDDDTLPIISIDDATAIEGNAIPFPVTLSSPSATDITLTFTFTNGRANDDDYTSTNIQATIPAGTTSINVDVPTTDDTFDEIDEDFTISILSIDSGVVGDTSDTATGTIIDDDDTIDIDSDNDGIIDSIEDLNADGDNDPSTNPTNSDNDAYPDYLDIDSDNDGIPDNVEAQTTAGYIEPSLVDANNNGLDDAYENGTNLGLIPVNTDGEDQPDYLDLDSDNDNVLDAIEAHDQNQDGLADVTFIGSDKDNDGLDDGYEGLETLDDDVNDEIDNPFATLPNTDGDEELDYRDIDDDNDGIPTLEEDTNSDGNYANDDENNNGIPNYLEEPYTPVEVFNVVTPNGDGAHDTLTITGLETRPNNNIQIYNRWGILVFSKESYDTTTNYFDGYSTARLTSNKEERLPSGTYFYILNYEDTTGENKTLSGYIYLN